MNDPRTPIRVLLIDDDPADRELARLALDKAERSTFVIQYSCSLTEAEPAIRSNEYDVLLLDLGLPECFGMETLVRVRALNPSIPIVVLTDLSDEQAALKCLNEGAQDYLLKSHLALESLSRAVRCAIQRQQLHEQLSSANALLAQRNAELARLCDTAQKFVDNVSHEFRTPLTVITEYVALLREGVVGDVELDAEQQRFLSILADRADDLNTMVDDMLDVSKLQAGLLSTWRKDCQLTDILRHLQPALESKAKIKKVDLEFQIPEDLPTIYCDGEKVGRVVINLVVNAIKFCGDPGMVVVAARVAPTAREMVIEVTDNGPGISREDQERIFGRFQQLKAGEVGPQKGFGLGLSIAKELVDLNLGQLYLRSEVGTGTTFSFTVPLADPVEVTRRYAQRLTAESPGVEVAILEAALAEEESAAAADDFDAFMNYALKPADLLFRCGLHRWLLLVPLRDAEPADHIARLEKLLVDANRNRPGYPLPETTIQVAGQWRVEEPRLLLEQLETSLENEELEYA